jgi:hypothetical protein
MHLVNMYAENSLHKQMAHSQAKLVCSNVIFHEFIHFYDVSDGT